MITWIPTVNIDIKLYTIKSEHFKNNYIYIYAELPLRYAYNHIARTQLTLLFVWEELFLPGIGLQSDDRPRPMVLFKATLWMAVMQGSSTKCEKPGDDSRILRDQPFL